MAPAKPRRQRAATPSAATVLCQALTSGCPDPNSAKVVALWPGLTVEYRRAIQRPNFADYRFG